MHSSFFPDVFVFVGIMTALGCVTRIILAFIHRPRGGGANALTLTEIAQRLAHLEQAADATAIEVERIAEVQRFTTKLLVERGHPGASVEAARGRVVTPH